MFNKLLSGAIALQLLLWTIAALYCLTHGLQVHAVYAMFMAVIGTLLYILVFFSSE